MIRKQIEIENSINIIKFIYLENSKDEVICSKKIASKLNISDKFVLKTLGKLTKHNLLAVKRGQSGGFKQCTNKNIENITISELLKSIIDIEEKNKLNQILLINLENITLHMLWDNK